MSSSPCCAGYKFPPCGDGGKPQDDYFASKPPVLTTLTSVSPKKTMLKSTMGSFSSLGSELTLSGSYSSGGFSVSTDTLVDDGLFGTPGAAARRNRLLLTVSVPQRHIPSSLSLGPLSQPADIFGLEADANKYPQSAVEGVLPFPRKMSVDDKISDGPRLGTSPALRKQMTLPLFSPTYDGLFAGALTSQQGVRTQPQNMRSAILGLSPSITYLAPLEIALRVAQAAAQPETSRHIVVDIRPFADYVKHHVLSAINVCLPLTLLKRSNFSFKRCVNSLPAHEKTVILTYLENSGNLAPIIVYDNSNSSANLYHMCKKLIDYSCWDVSRAPMVYIVDTSFEAFHSAHPAAVSTGKSELVEQAPPLSQTKRPSLEISIPPPPVRSQSAPGLATLTDIDTPTVSNFSLPQNLPRSKFKIRHNEEVFDIVENPAGEDLSSYSSADLIIALPAWLRNSLAESTKISEAFVRLEECERLRLNIALSLKNQAELVTPGGRTEPCPAINCGLDYGHKNRYKDIFLFEHSRVKLQPSRDVHGSDYINASYLDPLNDLKNLLVGGNAVDQRHLSHMRYVATQGPLHETVGDFWKCVINQQCLVIVSLSSEYENGMQKCCAYWNPGTYYSGGNTIAVELTNVEHKGNLVFRTFAASIDDSTVQHVMQIHLDKWEDMSASVDLNALLAIVALKRHILGSAAVLPRYPTLIHCSAGCGRTGVFSVVDTLITILELNNNKYELPVDPIYELVNNFRRQRILMVQTLRQYSFLYDAMAQYVSRGCAEESLCSLEIVKDYVSQISVR